eukprot:280008-Karenia_brevis.AAC.1
MKRMRQPDKHAAWLLEQSISDCKMGSMKRTNMDVVSLSDITISPRFAVERGERLDGSLRLRACDDLSASLCNAATAAEEKLKCDTLDMLLAKLDLLACTIEVRACSHS